MWQPSMPTGVLISQKEFRLPSAFQHAAADIQTDGMRVAGRNEQGLNGAF